MRLEAVTIDCRDRRAMAAFWSAVLGTTVRGELGQYVGLRPVQAGHPRLIFQEVPDLVPGRNRLHLDLETEDLERDTARVLALGGLVVEDVSDLGTRWRVLSDPEGNLFCLVPAEGGSEPGRASEVEQ